jgi:hypothetical protein
VPTGGKGLALMVGHRGPRPEAQGCRRLPELRGEGGPRVPTGGKARNASAFPMR